MVVEHLIPKEGLDVVGFVERVGPGAFRRLVELGVSPSATAGAATVISTGSLPSN